jgi:vanillate O-demethylase monooxygenase subunit
MSYPKQQWYVAAMTNEVSRTLFARRILDEPIVFFRTEGGAPVALAGLCPHRLYPLVQGRLKGDQIECGYHGITFDGTGKCVRIPSQDKIPPTLAVRRYPVHEVGGWVWIWMGTASSADVLTLPDLSKVGIATPGFRHEFNPPRHLAARYQLLIDNLMDLSHISFIHAATVPKEERGVFSVRRTFSHVPANGFVKFLHPDIDGNVDNVLTSDYFGPCLINAGGPYLTKPGEAAERQMNFVHAITPESPHSTHYFNGISRNFSLDNDELSQVLLAQSAAVIAEDIRALGLIEAALQAGGGSAQREISVLKDAGALKVRRLLARQIKAELENQGALENQRGSEPALRPSAVKV